MNDGRPNPDELLSRVEEKEAKQKQARLKIFFGYAAGVGKTFAMLEAARREKAAGTDVVIGYVEPHGRVETEALLDGLESIPPLQIAYRGITLQEFDLDRAIERRPALILVDELAHTNVEGSRHAKRWQDVFELLDEGIDVWTTLNVQHIESLNDVIAQITGINVRETLPDVVIERAADIELVDITPDELLQRLRQGKVYIPTQAEQALQHFFQQPKLTALRELSMRQAVRRLHRDVDEARHESGGQHPWATGERLIVCIGPNPSGARLVRAAKRIANALDAEWIAVSVSTGDSERLSPGDREQIANHLRLAESLGAEAHQIAGPGVVDAVLDYAHSRNVNRVLLGKSIEPWWRRLTSQPLVDELLEKSGDIDVFLVQGDEQETASEAPRPFSSRPSIVWWNWISSVLIVAAAAVIGWPMHQARLAEANMVMVFLAAVAIVSARFGRGPSILASVLGVLTFDVLFVPPYFNFTVNDAQYLFTFAVMLTIGLLISTITARLRQQMTESNIRERATHSLYRISKQLGEASGLDFLVTMAGQQLSDLFESEVVIYLSPSEGLLDLRFGKELALVHDSMDRAVAEWVAEHSQPAGRGTDTLPKAKALYLPLVGSQRPVGVVGVRTRDSGRMDDPDQRRMLDTCVRQIALAIERDEMTLRAYDAKLEAEAERMRSSLLSSVSHDLRTPLAVITGAVSSLLSTAQDRMTDAERDLAESVVDEAQRMSRLVDNLLDMTRLESPTLTLRTEPHVLEELVGSALTRTESLLGTRQVTVQIPDHLPLVQVDGLLIEQLLVNLLENAVRYTPESSPIELVATVDKDRVRLIVSDRGPGLPPGNEIIVFEKFFRGSAIPDSSRGVGLGLAICKAIADAHHGKIEAHNRDGGGAEFIVWLPVAGRECSALPLETMTVAR